MRLPTTLESGNGFGNPDTRALPVKLPSLVSRSRPECGLEIAHVVEKVIPFLTLAEVSALEPLNPFVHEVILSSGAWDGVASREMNALACISERLTDRHVIKSLIGILRTFAVEESLPIPLHSLKEVSNLIRTFEKAKRRASNHELDGGSVAHIFIWCFRFAMEPTSPGHGPGAPGSSDTLCTFLDLPTFETYALEISLNVLEDSVMVKTRIELVDVFAIALTDSITCAPGKTPALVLDLDAISTEVLIQKRGVAVNADGSEKGHGICMSTSKRTIMEAIGADGLPCVLLVRDNSDIHDFKLANALSFDRIVGHK